MKHLFTPFVNPVQLIQAYRFHKKTGRYDRTANDLELKLYSKILKNDMLHYGYFDDVDTAPEFISIGILEQAQSRYAEIIAEQILDKNLPVLDVGCGMGGLSNFLLSRGINVEALTPDRNQIAYERDITPNVLPTLKLIHMYVDRYLIPLSHYAEEKLIYKKAWLFYLTKNLRHHISIKSKKELLSVQPELFVAEKKYMLYVLQKEIPSS